MLRGKSVNPGFAIGKAYLHQPSTHRVFTASDAPTPDQHWEKLKQALNQAKQEWLALIETIQPSASNGSKDIINAHMTIAEDVDVMRRAKEAIYTQHMTGEQAYANAMLAYINVFDTMPEGLFNQRKQDIQDVLQRVLTNFQGRQRKTPVFHEATVIIGNDLRPSTLLEIVQPNCVAIVLEQGGLTSHTAILAKQLDIPVLMQVEHLLTHVSPGDRIEVNGQTGSVRHHDGDAAMTLEQKPTRLNNDVSDSSIDLPCALAINVLGPRDLPAFKDTGATAIGLFRTEFLDDLSPQAQSVAYQAMFDLNVPVIVRLFDFGADKVLPIEAASHATSPLGLRGLRLLRHVPHLLLNQLDALFEAGAGKTLTLEYPMVVTRDEFLWGKAFTKKRLEERRSQGLPLPAHVQFGPLIEVPSFAMSLEDTIQDCDFIGIGTNDLQQYYFAADRNDGAVNALYDHFEPGFLRLLNTLIKTANAYQKPVTLCGEMACDPVAGFLLSGMGDITLSVPPKQYRSLRKQLHLISARASGKAWVERVLKATSRQDVASLLETLLEGGE